MPTIPIPGIILIVALFAFLALCFCIDRRAGKRFLTEIKEQYPAKDSFKDMFVTERGELLYYWPTGSLPGYKKWELADIAYVASYKNSFGVYDANMKPLRGEYLTPSKKHVTDRAVNFPVGWDKALKYTEFIQKCGPHIQQMRNWKVQS